jgi:hypothetical protein
MKLLATFECFGTAWTAEQLDDLSPRHYEIAAGAHQRRTPYCRKHLSGPQHGRVDPLPEQFRNALLREKFDLFRPGSDLLVVRHDLTQDATNELAQLQVYGRDVLSAAGVVVPDYDFFDSLSVGTVSGAFGNSNLGPSEIDDLQIARNALTGMMFRKYND